MNKTVPIEPTPEMINALRTGSKRDYPSDELCRVRYAALLAAAPAVPAEPVNKRLLEALRKAVKRQGFSNEELIDARAAIRKAEQPAEQAAHPVKPEFAAFADTPEKRFLYEWGKRDGYQDGYAAALEQSKAVAAQPVAWKVVTWNSKTDRTFYTRPEALDYLTMNDAEGDWHIEPVLDALPLRLGASHD